MTDMAVGEADDLSFVAETTHQVQDIYDAYRAGKLPMTGELAAALSQTRKQLLAIKLDGSKHPDAADQRIGACVQMVEMLRETTSQSTMAAPETTSQETVIEAPAPVFVTSEPVPQPLPPTSTSAWPPPLAATVWEPPAPSWQPLAAAPSLAAAPAVQAALWDRRPRRGWRWGPVGIATIAAIAVIAAAAIVVIQRSADGESYPAAWDPRVAPIAQFVQAQRGLSWKHPVKVEFLAPVQFDALMAKENAPSAKTTDDAQTVFDAMRALGVASGNVDLAKSAQQFAQADVVGQYVDSDRTVYVRGNELTPYVRSVLAHELTHALQAQYFDLQKMESGPANDDSAVTALIEGDAVRVQNAYEQALSPTDLKLLVQEQQQDSGQASSQSSQNNIPQFLVDQSQFPYDFGPTFVAALLAKGGNSEVDTAFRNPPNLDGQIVDPELYVPGGWTPTVTLPSLPKDARQISPPSGFGMVTLLEMLGDQIGFDSAWPAIQGWTQDRFVVYRQNGQVCVDVAVLNDSQTSAASLAGVGRAWASHLPSASVNQSGTTVDFQACDPGAGWKPSTHVADPYQTLAARSVLIYQLITEGHLQSTTAACAADQLMTSMGTQKLQDAEQSANANSPAVQQLLAGLRAAVTSCA